jgi:hypothetical protein
MSAPSNESDSKEPDHGEEAKLEVTRKGHCRTRG